MDIKEEIPLMSWAYVYRKSYKRFNKIGVFLSLIKFLLSAGSVSAIASPPLASLGVIAGVIEILDRSLKIRERKQCYKEGYKFYRSLYHLYSANEITKKEIILRELEFWKNIDYFPVEKYLKKKGLNGYSRKNSTVL